MKKFAIFCFCLTVFLPAFRMQAAEALPAEKARPLSVDSAQIILNMAVTEFKSISKKEKKSRFRDAKKLMRQYNAGKMAGNSDETDTSLILLAILAILVPPLAIYLKERELSWKFWATLALMVTGIIFLSALPFLWILAAGLALLTVFDVL